MRSLNLGGMTVADTVETNVLSGDLGTKIISYDVLVTLIVHARSCEYL